MTKKKITKEPEVNSNLFWNMVKGLTVLLGLLGAFYAIDSRFASSEDLKKQEQQTVKTLEMFQDKMEEKFLRGRLDTLQDQKRQLKIMIKKTPGDTDLQEQITETDKEIGTVKNKLDTLDKK